MDSKYERCVIGVKDKQSNFCAKHKYKAYLYDPTSDKHCYNPWAVCGHVSREKNKSTRKQSSKRKSLNHKSNRRYQKKLSAGRNKSSIAHRSSIKNRKRKQSLKSNNIKIGPRGGRYYLKGNKKVYIR